MLAAILLLCFPRLPFFRVDHVVIGAGRFSTSFECQLFANNKQILERQQQPCWAGNLICKNVRNEWATGRVEGRRGMPEWQPNQAMLCRLIRFLVRPQVERRRRMERERLN